MVMAAVLWPRCSCTNLTSTSLLIRKYFRCRIHPQLSRLMRVPVDCLQVCDAIALERVGHHLFQLLRHDLHCLLDGNRALVLRTLRPTSALSSSTSHAKGCNNSFDKKSIWTCWSFEPAMPHPGQSAWLTLDRHPPPWPMASSCRLSWRLSTRSAPGR